MVVTDTGHDSTKITRFFGLSTDTKPTKAMVDAKFYETDTKRMFVFDGVAFVREAQTVVEQAAAVVVEQVRTTDERLDGILAELKKQTTHLALITGEEELDAADD